jgi:hypothetical protein
MAENYVLLERTELNASAASVTFANIPQTGYTDLKVVFSLRSSRTPSTDGAHIALTFNNNTSSVYSFKHIRGNGSAASSYGESATTSINLYSQADSSADTANTFSNNEIYIPNYTGATNKSISVDSVYENNATTAGQHLVAGLFASTAAITSIKLAEGFGNNWVAGSTASLYGIAAVGTTPAIAPKASGGNVIDYDGTYWIHTFTSSGTFTPQTGLTCDYLVVAGGAGGGFATSGGDYGAGGGAGGMRSTVTATGGGGSLESAISVASGTNYAITVGAGGAAQSTLGLAGNNGNDSIFATITSTAGGGGAGGGTSQLGKNGGSGGGGATGGAPGTASPSGQGYAGGAAPGGGYAAGGGGAGGVGSSASSQNVAGGAGVATSITGSSVTYAAGGRGGVVSAGSGTTNTGNGGEGKAGATGSSGAGGSGIVIIRYPAA